MGLLISPDKRINFYTVSVAAHQHKRLFTAIQDLHYGDDMKIIYKTVKYMNVRSRLLSQNLKKNKY